MGNIPVDTTEDMLTLLLREFGSIVDFRFFNESSANQIAYAFCEYENPEMALRAIHALNDFVFRGQLIKVDSAASGKSKEELENFLQGGLSISKMDTENIALDATTEKAPEEISKAVASLPPEQMFELMKQMKMCIENNPHEARNLLLQNPQLAYALLQAQVIMHIVDPEVALKILDRPLVVPTAANNAPASEAAAVPGDAPPTNAMETNTAFFPGGIPVQSNPPAVNQTPALVPPSMLSNMMAKGFSMNIDQDMRQPMRDSDMRNLPIPEGNNHLFDPRFRAGIDPRMLQGPNSKMQDPRIMPVLDPRGISGPDPRGMPGMDPRSLSNLDPRAITGPDSRGISVPDPRGLPVPDPRGISASNPRGMLFPDPRGVPVSDPRAMPNSDPRGIPVSDPRGMPISDPRGMPISDPRAMSISDPRAMSGTDPRTMISHDPRTVPNSDPRAAANPDPRILQNLDPRSLNSSDPRAMRGQLPDPRVGPVIDPRISSAQNPKAGAMEGRSDPRMMSGVADPRMLQGDPRGLSNSDPRARQGSDPRVKPAPIEDPRKPPILDGASASASRLPAGPRVPIIKSEPGTTVAPSNAPDILPGMFPTSMPQDKEKAALIMQVLQLSDEQISMLPPDQRQSILILKEQISRSQLA
ncbi:cleavage stimulation factor subunit 2 isoform X2 [Parasteatoda tepidariorum]|nr:cleavage stimulation factor subunit 2 [Parasteatoda tepidariorum]